MEKNIAAINEELADLIMGKDKSGTLELSDIDMELSWTWFDDDAENCGTSKIESISVGTSVDGETLIFVEFDNRETATLDNLNYEDVLGNNFAQWLYYELV